MPDLPRPPLPAQGADVSERHETDTRGTLYCIPVPLSPDLPMDQALTSEGLSIAAGLQAFVAENAKTARAFLKTLPLARPLQAIDIREIDASTPTAALIDMLAPLKAGRSLGLMSEAGCPGVADPGARLIALAHDQGHRVIPLIGPSSLLLALMASGLNGQRFAFVGYLPAAPAEREAALRSLEQRSARADETLLAIETPYRAQAWVESALRCLSADTRLTLARSLTLPGQSVTTKTVADWRTSPPSLGKALVVFALHAGSHRQRNAGTSDDKRIVRAKASPALAPTRLAIRSARFSRGE